MFLFLQFLCSVFLLAGIFLYFRKIKKRSGVFIIGLAGLLVVSSCMADVFLDAIPMPTEKVCIEATGDRNSKSIGNEIAVQNVIVDGTEYSLGKVLEGNWVYSKGASAYMWMDASDERLSEPITQKIVLEVPVGAGRKFAFLTSDHSGMVTVSYKDTVVTYDLYKKKSGTRYIHIPDTNGIYDNFVKIMRLAGYVLMILGMLGVVLIPIETHRIETLNRILCLASSIFMTLAFSLNMETTKRSGNNIFSLIADFNKSINFNSESFLLSIIIVPLLYFACKYCMGIYQKQYNSLRATLCIAIPSGIFALFMIMGNAFSIENTLRPIFENELQRLKSLCSLMGYFSFFFFGITWLYSQLDQIDVYKPDTKKHIRPVHLYLNHFEKRPFIVSFVTMSIAYIPYIIASYPAILMGDCSHQFGMIYGDYAFTNAHPVSHTLFMKFCLNIGDKLFNSVNIGIFIYAMIQFLFVVTIISFLNKLIIEWGISSKISFFFLLYYICHPRVQNYMFVVTKDVIDSTFLLLFMASLCMLFAKKRNWKVYLLLGLSAVGSILFRRDSTYIIILSLLCIFFILRDFRRSTAVITAALTCFVFSWNAFLSYLNIPQSRPETNPYYGMLGRIMVQQTARYLRDAGDEVTKEEKEIISACFDYEAMVKKYQPDNKADGAASTFKKDITKERWRAYQKTWFNMFFKHPEIYLEATLNIKYDHLYPYIVQKYRYGWSVEKMDSINKKAIYMPSFLSYPESQTAFQAGYEVFRESFSKVPILNFPFITASYFWILFVWFAYCVYRKKRISIAIMMPLLILVFVLIAGPANARYFRYIYPYSLCLPAVIILGLTIEQPVKQSRILAEEAMP